MRPFLVARCSALLASLMMAGPAFASLETGRKGASVYCSMRARGNPHEVSWTAAYERMKRQSTGLFKISPKHAAVVLTEAVIEDNNSTCMAFLGDIFARHSGQLP
ncbi:MAG: penicillin amidase, partial [Aphanocapsa feldmannii 288cV]